MTFLQKLHVWFWKIPWSMVPRVQKEHAGIARGRTSQEEGEFAGAHIMVPQATTI